MSLRVCSLQRFVKNLAGFGIQLSATGSQSFRLYLQLLTTRILNSSLALAFQLRTLSQFVFSLFVVFLLVRGTSSSSRSVSQLSVSIDGNSLAESTASAVHWMILYKMWWDSIQLSLRELPAANWAYSWCRVRPLLFFFSGV